MDAADPSVRWNAATCLASLASLPGPPHLSVLTERARPRPTSEPVEQSERKTEAIRAVGALRVREGGLQLLRTAA